MLTLFFAGKSESYLKLYKRIEQYFFETKAYKEAEAVFNKNGIVVFTGPPGCGKTMAAIHLIRKELRDWTFRKIDSWKELNFINDNEINENTLVFIDNIFYDQTIDLHLEKWCENLDTIHKSYFESNRFKHKNRVRIVMTARPNVIENACAHMNKITPIFNNKHLIDVGNLSGYEKDNILDKQREFAMKEKRASVPNIDAKFKRKVRETEGPIGFPLCAHLYACSVKYQKSGAIFFSHPIECLKLHIKYEIENDQTQSAKTLFFYLFIFEWHSKTGLSEKVEITNPTKCQQFLNKVSIDLISNFSPFNFRNLEREAKRLSGVFLKKEGENSYKFSHESVYEAVGIYFCETYVLETAKHFPLEILQYQEYENLTKVQETLVKRLVYEVLNHQLSAVFSCRILQNEKFADLFCSELERKEDKTIWHIFTDANESSSVKHPCIFWSSYSNLFYITERLYNIVKKRKIDPDYQFYATLYGLCCARSNVSLETTNGMLQNKYEFIKKRVIDFRDPYGNSILHFISASTFSDTFASFAVEKIVKDGLTVDSRNKFKINPN